MIAVEPAILSDALVEVFESTGVDEVLDMKDLVDLREPGSFDAALVTAGLAEDVPTEVRIELPDEQGSSGVGRVSLHGHVEAVAIRDLFSIFDVLDTYCPGQRGRRQRIGH